jgi:hypothetical protein
VMNFPLTGGDPWRGQELTDGHGRPGVPRESRERQ